jgi:hypothetical protein
MRRGVRRVRWWHEPEKGGWAMIDTDEVLARLKGLGLLDTYHVTTFKAIHRKRSDGVQAVTVEDLRCRLDP